MNAHDIAAAGKVRRSRTLRAIASHGMIPTMQAVIVGQMHDNPRVPLTDNPLTWNHWTFAFECAENVLTHPNRFTANAAARLSA